MATATISSLMLAIFGLPGGTEWIVLLVLGLLIFGRRLPEVGRNMARSIVEFKKGLRNVEQEVEDASNDDERDRLTGESRSRELPRSSPSGTQQREPADKPYATAERRSDE